MREADEIESPLSIIIKFHSIEEIGDINNPSLDSLIDFDQVYKNDSLEGKFVWEQIVGFQNNLARDKKFHNNHLYHELNIREKIDKERAEVTFIKNSFIEKFELIRTKKSWKIVKRNIKHNK